MRNHVIKWSSILYIDIKYYFLLAFILQLLPSLIFTGFNIDNTNRSVQIIEQLNSNLITFLFVVIIGPFFETLFFQFLLINMVRAIFSETRYTMFLSVIIPSIIFGLSHSYNLYYTIFGFLTGIVYSSTYYTSQFLRKENAFIIVLILHSLNNFLAFLTN